MTKFTQEDLNKLGLKNNGSGVFSKEKKTIAVNVSGIEFESGLPKKKSKKTEPVYFNGMDVQDVYENGEKEGFIFLKGQCPSSKNSKQLFKNKKTGKTFITSSNLCKEYIKETEIHYKLFASKFHELVRGKEKPYKIEFTFIRDSHRKSDFHNLVQLPLDLMQHYGWIEDDNMDEILPFPGNPAYGYDKQLAGIIIKIL